MNQIRTQSARRRHLATQRKVEWEKKNNEMQRAIFQMQKDHFEMTRELNRKASENALKSLETWSTSWQQLPPERLSYNPKADDPITPEPRRATASTVFMSLLLTMTISILVISYFRVSLNPNDWRWSDAWVLIIASIAYDLCRRASRLGN